MNSGASGGEGDGVPEKVGPYRIESRLGAGGMGAVYRAWDERLKRPLAIKQILTTLARDETTRERFRHEAQTAAGLSHPAIVQIYDIVETDEGDWIVMELVEGRSLRSLLEDGPIDVRRALQLGRQIADGLAAAHARGIVHRDLKTENVMVTALGRAKILDFGLAKRLLPDGHDSGLSGQGAVVGTVRAMSPEQVMGLPVDPRSDLFSFGTLLYEILTDVSPFLVPNSAQTMARVCTLQHEPLSRVDPRIPAALSDLVDRLLAKDPEHRPQTAAEVEATLERIVSDPSAARPPLLPSVAPQETSSAGAPPLPVSGPPHSGFSETRPEQESATVVKTLLLSDMVDSTRLVERLGDEGVAALFQRHDRLARDLLAEHGGFEIDKSDGFLLLFDRPLSAVLYALAYHRTLAALSREEGVELCSRVGIHVGEVLLHRNAPRDVARGAKPLEVEGLAKPMAARLMALAQGSQSLISRGVYDMARRGLVGSQVDEEELCWPAHGKYRFRGVEEPVEVFEVGVERLAPLSPPPDSEKARRVHDGSSTLSGVLLARPRNVLAAVALSLAVAAAVMLLWGRGVAVPEARRSVSILGFKNVQGQPSEAWLSTAFSEMLRTELQANGKLRILPGESVARMKIELDLPETDTLATDTLEKVRRNLGTDYVVLGSFLVIGSGRERTVRLDFRLQDTTTGETVASAWESGDEEDLFAIVTTAGSYLRDALSLEAPSAAQAGAARAAISSSPEATTLYSKALIELRGYDAMTARDLLVEAVAADPAYALAHAALSEAWLKLGYDQEAQKSAGTAFELAREKQLPREETLWIEGRYHEASAHRQEAIDAYQALWKVFPANVDYGLRLAAAQTAASQAHAALATLDELRRLPQPLRDDPRIDLADARAAVKLSQFQRQLASAERAKQKGETRGARILVADAQQEIGWASSILGDLEKAIEACEESRRLYAEVGDRGKEAAALRFLGNFLDMQGRPSRAEERHRQALEVHRQIGNRKMIASGLVALAGLAEDRGELAAARKMFEESLAIAREVGDPRRQALRLASLGLVLEKSGDLAAAADKAREALALAEAGDEQRLIAWSLFLMGHVELSRGRLDDAQARYEEALGVARAIGEKRLSGMLLHRWATLLRTRGDLAGAESSLRQAEKTQSEFGDLLYLARTRLDRAALLLHQHKPAEAEGLARSVAAQFARARARDQELLAAAVIAHALFDQGKLAAAREVLADPRARAGASESPHVRVRLAVTAARLDAAAGESGKALADLRRIAAEAASLGFVGLALEARLAGAEIAAAAGAPGDLEALTAEAQDLGFRLIAQQGAELLRRTRSE